MKKLEQKVIKFIDDKELIKKDDKVLIALSGGPDSVFLLHFLNKYKRRFKVTLGAVHINHLLRGKDADSDEGLSKKIAKKYKIDFHSVKKDVKEFSRKNKISIEEAGREIRYKEFEEISEKFGYTKIATAHNSSDNAETIFLNLIKGTGIKGLAGIPIKRDKIIRPILSLTKDEILHYLLYYKIRYNTDASNLSKEYERNYLRNQIFPLIRKRLNNSIESTLFHTSEIFKNYSSLIDKIISLELKEISVKDYLVSIPLDRIKNIYPELLGDFLKAAVERNFYDPVTFNDLERIKSIIEKTAGTTVHLSNKLKAVKERDRIVLLKNVLKENFNPVKVELEKSVNINEKKISVKKVLRSEVKFSEDRTREYISGDDIKETFELRRWRAGDWFFPLGLKESKNISDFLTEQKIPSFNKKAQLVLTCSERIVWVVGLRIDERFKVTSKTKKVIELCLT